MEKVKYLQRDNGIFYYAFEGPYFKEDLLEWQKRGLVETSTGYGVKLTTIYKVSYNNRWYRVYASCSSNVAVYFIVSKGKKLYIK